MCLYVPGFQRQVLKYVSKRKWIPQTKFQWIPHIYTCNVNFVGTFVLLRIPQQANIASCSGFHLQFADSTYNLRIPLTVADSATAQFNDTNVLSFVCGFHKLFWIPQIQLRIPQIRLVLEQFSAIKWFRCLFVESKTALKIKEK